MKLRSLFLVALWLSATGLVLAQPTFPVLSQTTVTNGEFCFSISATDASNCVVQTATGNGNTWQNIGAASNRFCVPLVTDGVPHHFRVRCEAGGLPFYSVNGVTYYGVRPPAGFAMLSYPLESISNTLSNLLPDVSEGTLLHWHNPALGRMETAQFQFGRWSHPNLQIPRGRAVMLWSPPQANPVYLHGSFAGGSVTNCLAFGFNLVSPAWPTGSPLPPQSCEGRTALQLIGTDGIDPLYRTYIEFAGTWYDQDFNVASPPFPAFGGLWLEGCGSCWTQTRTFAAGDSAGAEGGEPPFGPMVIYFNNYVPGFGIDARLVHTNGTAPSGTNWLAQLFVGAPGTPENNLVASGEPLPFLSGAQAGYLDTSAGATRIPTNAPAYSNAVAQIRYWDARTGVGYELATVKGNTPLFLVPTRPQGITPPVPMLGLMSPRLTLARSLLPSAARLTVQGYRGMVYRIESSVTLSNWTALSTVTNAAAASTWVDADAAIYPQRFYRATIVGPAP